MKLEAKNRLQAEEIQPHVEPQTSFEQQIILLLHANRIQAVQQGFRFSPAADVEGGRALCVDSTNVFQTGYELYTMFCELGFVQENDAIQDMPMQGVSVQLRNPDNRIVWLSAEAAKLVIYVFEQP